MNPVAYARYLSSISTTRLAKELGVSRQYISRLEQGLYDKPNPKLVQWTRDVLNKHVENPLSHGAVEQLYREWQWQKRESVKLNKALRPLTITQYDLVRQPVIMDASGSVTSGVVYYYKIFTQWRNDYWTTSHNFCVDMCLHPSPVAEYEEGLTHTMPNNLKKVLNELKLIEESFKTNER